MVAAFAAGVALVTLVVRRDDAAAVMIAAMRAFGKKGAFAFKGDRGTLSADDVDQ